MGLRVKFADLRKYGIICEATGSRQLDGVAGKEIE